MKTKKELQAERDYFEQQQVETQELDFVDFKKRIEEIFQKYNISEEDKKELKRLINCVGIID